MPYNYNDTPPSREFDLIPHGTTATVVMHIRPGGVGEDGLLKRSKDGGCEMLDVEYVVADGPHARRKMFANMVLAGTTDGHAQAAEISRGMLRSILESARGIKPGDTSPQAYEQRKADLKDFEGMTFIAKIGVEKGRPKNDGSGENWSDKNVLAEAITPDKKNWHPVEQPPPWNGGSAGSTAPASPAPGINKPSWAS